VSWPVLRPHTLRQYALLADGERGALIGPRGDVAFMCAPRWHDDAVFATMLGGKGSYAVTPAEQHSVWGGSYEEGSLIWRSRWVTATSTIECREALVLPGDRSTAVLLRRIVAQHGTARVAVSLDCRAGFGGEPMHAHPVGDVWEGRSGPLKLRWSGAGRDASIGPNGLYVSISVPQGQCRDLVLELSSTDLPARPPDPGAAWAATEEAWAAALGPDAGSVAPGDSRHSLAVLHGLTSSEGGMAAAATTSLPERARQGRDYDYRYAWIRDQCFAGQAAAAAGQTALLDAAVGFVADRLVEDGSGLMPVYTVDGNEVPKQREVDLPGYPGSEGVCVGNRAGRQFQLDSFGEALLLFAAADQRNRLDSHGWAAAESAATAIGERWGEPDAGVWELSNRRWTHSRLMAAAGLRAMAARPAAPHAKGWDQCADMLIEDALRDGVHPDGRWQRAPDDPRCDAALLMPALRGAVPWNDPRSVATWRAVVDDLSDDGYVYRFRHDDQPLNASEGAFLLCGFHLALATQQQGEQSEAMRWFERTRAALGPPGLFTEEFDVVQRQLRGNLPQAFVHALLVEAAHKLRDDGPTRHGFRARRR